MHPFSYLGEHCKAFTLSNTDADFFYLSSTVRFQTVTVMVIFG